MIGFAGNRRLPKIVCFRFRESVYGLESAKAKGRQIKINQRNCGAKLLSVMRRLAMIDKDKLL
ncbi:MAG TPA: hypothetical protein VGQ21_16590 [Thermoanaerobaculia bacterium]|nr:hypothetical protein [Thermoanaerobaculia bacterium]